jgi:hypothetical protein
VLKRVCVDQSLVLYVVFCRALFVFSPFFHLVISGASKRIFATIKSTIDAVKLSYTIQLSPF